MKMSVMTHILTKALVFALATAAALASCTRLEEDSDDAVGYLAFPTLDVDVTVDNPADTKAEGLTVEEPTDLSTAVFIIKKDGTEVRRITGPWDEPIALESGSYSIEASLGSNDFGTPYFVGTCTATIEKLAEAAPDLTMALANSLVRVTVDPSLAGDFLSPDGDVWSSSDEVTLASESGSYDASYGQWTFIPAGQSLAVSMKGKSSAGVDATFSYTLPTTPAAKTGYDIICRKDETNWPTITLPDQQAGAWAGRLYVTPVTADNFTNVSEANQGKVEYEVIAVDGDWTNPMTAELIEGNYYVVKDLANGSSYQVRARVGNLVSEPQTVQVQENLPGMDVSFVHTYSGSTLTGTDATLALSLGDGILSTLHSAGLLSISSALTKGNDSVRTLDGLSGKMGGNTTEWPYLPQGSDYTLTVSHWAKNDSADKDASVKSGFAVTEKPKFTVNMTQSYSSYDYYRGENGMTQNTSYANDNCTGESIYNAGATWTILPEIMSKDHYSKEAIIILDGDETSRKTTPTTNSYNVGEITGNSWTTHTLTAKVTFDGVTVAPAAAKTHVITGLPYSYDFHANRSIPSNWKSYGTRWENTGSTNKLLICRNGSDGYLISPKFNYSGISKYTVEAQYYSTVSSTIHMYVGGVSSAESSGPETPYDDYSIKSNMTTGETHSPYSDDVDLSSTPYVAIHHNNNDSRIGIDYLCIYEFHLKYVE